MLLLSSEQLLCNLDLKTLDGSFGSIFSFLFKHYFVQYRRFAVLIDFKPFEFFENAIFSSVFFSALLGIRKTFVFGLKILKDQRDIFFAQLKAGFTGIYVLF